MDETQSIKKDFMKISTLHSLSNRVALITGASTGIGKAISERLAREGAIVYINYRGQSNKAKSLAAKIQIQGGIGIPIRADISKESDVKKMFQKILRDQGHLDIMVNNAGIENKAPILKMTTRDWDIVINTNLRGTFFCARAAAQMMAKKKSGVIINISSVHEVIPWGGYSHYCASKAGIMMLTKTMALELAALNIRVNNIAPGSISTPINNSWIQKAAKKKLVLDKIPERRIGTPEEVAGAVSYLVSDEARYITGISLFIDGGMTLYASFLKQG